VYSRDVTGIDRSKHVAHWRAGACEDLAASRDLADRGHARHALFFGHLAVEKTLKGLVTARTGEVPPRTHDLLRLAEKAGIDTGEERALTLARIGRYCVEGRYPESWGPAPEPGVVNDVLAKVAEILEWLNAQF